jgi:CheY-like chemotaxis protein
MRAAIDVLVVDDSDRDQRTTLSGIRRASESATVLRLKDGEQALQYLLRKGAFEDRNPVAPRMILLEAELPGISGLLVLDRIQHSEDTRNIPVILLSSTADRAVIEDALARGAREYVIKPQDRAEYIAEIARLVTRWTAQH